MLKQLIRHYLGHPVLHDKLYVVIGWLLIRVQGNAPTEIVFILPSGGVL